MNKFHKHLFLQDKETAFYRDKFSRMTFRQDLFISTIGLEISFI